MELTFRDPAGELRLAAGCALRRIRPPAVADTKAFLASPLRSSLEQSGDLIPSKVAEPGSHPSIAAGEFWLEHPRLDPISYPWEWTTAQWRAAAELTLRIASQAIDAGWTLKDATPLNILFSGPRPILVDVLSFERRDPHSSVWLAYGQFVRTFLLPLVAAKHLSWPLRATLFERDGYEPRQIYEALPRWRRLNPDLLDVVTLATVFERPGLKAWRPKAVQRLQEALIKYRPIAGHAPVAKAHRAPRQADSKCCRSARRQPMEPIRTIRRALSGHRCRRKAAVRQACARTMPSPNVSFTSAPTQERIRFWLPMPAPRLSRWTATPPLLAILGRAAAKQGKPVTALVANIARPTPAAGWRNREHLSLLERLTGGFDLVLMLAVIHHLILREQLPLAHVADLCASLTQRSLLLEWVPPSDPMFQEWLRGRDDLYGHLTESDLTLAFAPHFAVVDRAQLGNGRVLLLFDRISPVRTSPRTMPNKCDPPRAEGITA